MLMSKEDFHDQGMMMVTDTVSETSDTYSLSTDIRDIYRMFHGISALVY